MSETEGPEGDQLQVPVSCLSGVFPFSRYGVAKHTVSSGPALDNTGTALATLTVGVASDGGQFPPAEILHLKMYRPGNKLETDAVSCVAS